MAYWQVAMGWWMPGYWFAESLSSEMTVGLELDLMSSGYLTIYPYSQRRSFSFVPFSVYNVSVSYNSSNISLLDYLNIFEESSSCQLGLDSQLGLDNLHFIHL